jgi:TM2 domain-containing membrane protein YozV
MLPPMMRAPVPPPVGPRQPPPPAGFYGPPPYAAPIPGTGTYNVPPMAGQRVIYPAQATVVPVSAPRSRPLSPIPYPGLPPASAPPVAAHLPPYDHADKAMSDRSGLTAGLLQIFLGYFGAGRLYTGHVAIALLQLSTVWFTLGVTVCLGVGFGDGGLWPMMLISLIWPVVDGFVMISGGQRDSEGRRLR